uniref:Uncharacterized protein n=1 Tax=Oryza brachyantha TaxID=4533 RepID=J3L9A4_ORYBR
MGQGEGGGVAASANDAQEGSSARGSTATIPRIPPYPGRINTMEIKQHIQATLGEERSERYFTYLKMFLSSRMEKAVFDRVIVQTIGRENVRLHNHLLMAIIRNAFLPAPNSGAAPGAK